MINVIDEVLDGEELFYITPKKDAYGNTVYKIELATRVETPGTPHNKALFDSIDYDIKNIPNFVASESYTDTFNDGTSKTKTIQLSNDRFFLIKMFIDESFVSPSYRYPKEFIGIFDAKTKQILIYYSQSQGGFGAVTNIGDNIYWQGQKVTGGTYCTLTITNFNESTREITIEIVAHKASNSQVTWTFEATTLNGKF